MVDLGRRILGLRSRKTKQRDSELARKLVKSTNPNENILGLYYQLTNLQEDIKMYIFIIAVQLLVSSFLVLVFLLSVLY